MTENGVSEDKLAGLGEMMSDDERRRMKRFRFTRDQCRFLLSRAHLRCVLSRYAVTVDPAAWRFHVLEHGRPEIDPTLGIEDLHFSLSHTTDLLAVAVSRLPRVGVDVEDMRREIDLRGIAEGALTPNEQRRLAPLPEPEYRDRFFELWTLKEAYVKALGVGMSVPPDQVEFAVEGAQIVLGDVTRAARPVEPGVWRFHLHRPTPHHQMAVACLGQQGPEVIRWVTP